MNNNDRNTSTSHDAGKASKEPVSTISTKDQQSEDAAMQSVQDRELAKPLSELTKPANEISILSALTPVDLVAEIVSKQIDRDFDFGR